MRPLTPFHIMATIILMLPFIHGCLFPPRQTPENNPGLALQYFLSLDHEDIRDIHIPAQEGTSSALENVVRYRQVLEQQLIDILKNGPDHKAMETFNWIAEEQWQRRQTFLNKNHNLGLTTNELNKARSISREAYLKQRVDQMTHMYREKSAIALSAIGSPNALSALSEVGQSPATNADMRRAIDSAIERYKRPPLPRVIESPVIF